jgi:hypothetical protein
MLFEMAAFLVDHLGESHQQVAHVEGNRTLAPNFHRSGNREIRGNFANLQKFRA